VFHIKFDFQDVKPIIIPDLQSEKEEIVNRARIFVEQTYSKQRFIKDEESCAKLSFRGLRSEPGVDVVLGIKF